MTTYYLGKSGLISLLVSAVGIIVLVNHSWFQTGQDAKNGLNPGLLHVWQLQVIFTLSCFMEVSLTLKWQNYPRILADYSRGKLFDWLC